MKDKATARPLFQGPHYKTDVLDAQGNTYAEACPTFTPAGEARAREIIRSVNNAERLAESLRVCQQLLQRAASGRGLPASMIQHAAEAAEDARAALAAWESGGVKPQCARDRDDAPHPADVVHVSRVGGGYGHKPTGIAFYYYCFAHEPAQERTDMSEPLERRVL